MSDSWSSAFLMASIAIASGASIAGAPVREHPPSPESECEVGRSFLACRAAIPEGAEAVRACTAPFLAPGRADWIKGRLASWLLHAAEFERMTDLRPCSEVESRPLRRETKRGKRLLCFSARPRAEDGEMNVVMTFTVSGNRVFLDNINW
ncbi:MAG: hypothetical protein L6R30_14460 [Thermoanaerobaculia bacterium]|nr:hypothetical protein [Thermoanaerobaculia bacterium]